MTRPRSALRHHRDRIGRRRRHAHPRARPDRQAHPDARAGRLLPAGEAELGLVARLGRAAATATAGQWTDTHGEQFLPKQHYYVGGNTKFYGAVLFRMRERDFGEVTHVDGVSPAWPIDYADLEPYYTRAEHLYHVHGERRSTRSSRRRSAPYPHPAVSDEPRIAAAACRPEAAPGLHPFPLPIGIMLDEAGPASAAPASAARPATASRAWCRPRPTPTSCASSPRCGIPNVTLLHRRARDAAGDRARRAHRVSR